MKEWLSISSDARVTVQEVHDAGDTVVSVLTMDGTHDGQMAPLRPTGKRFRIEGVQIRFDEEGTIVGYDNFFDQLSYLVELGFVERPA